MLEFGCSCALRTTTWTRELEEKEEGDAHRRYETAEKRGQADEAACRLRGIKQKTADGASTIQAKR